jgi:hypothetical protein
VAAGAQVGQRPGTASRHGDEASVPRAWPGHPDTVWRGALHGARLCRDPGRRQDHRRVQPHGPEGELSLRAVINLPVLYQMIIVGNNSLILKMIGFSPRSLKTVETLKYF